MFLVDAETQVAVRRAFMVGGNAAATAALRARYLGLTEQTAESCAQSILSWTRSDPAPEQKSR